MSRAESYAQRIRNTAEATGVDANRLRRGLVFQRVLARLEGRPEWVLKGGFCLEARLALRARATVDLDLVTRSQFGDDGLDLQDALDEILERPLDDGFGFTVARPQKLSLLGERDAWRVTVAATVEGQRFADIKLDVVTQFDELVGAIDCLAVDPPISAPGLEGVEVYAVDVDQHAAEKFHAMARTYGGRPSSRVKDLVDLVLLAEAGLLSAERLGKRLVIVYRERDGLPPPATLPALPLAWEVDYPSLLAAHDLTVGAVTVTEAFELVGAQYVEAILTIERNLQ